jgi:hypothetical protein
MKARVPAVSKSSSTFAISRAIDSETSRAHPSARLHAMTLIVLAGDEIVDDRSPVS